jgi:hypothetical protein
MTTIKSYTDLQQSRKLAEILPLESADQTWARLTIVGANLNVPEELQYIHDGDIPFQYYSGIGTPCWSLAALLNVIPKDESIDCSISFGYYNGKGKYIGKWLCTFEKEDETKDGFIIETIDGDNPIDVLYEMILELNKLNMLLL